MASSMHRRLGIALATVAFGIGLMIVITCAPSRVRSREAARQLHEKATAALTAALQDANPIVLFRHATEALCYTEALRCLIDHDRSASQALRGDVRNLFDRVARLQRVATVALERATPGGVGRLTETDRARRGDIDRALANTTTPLTRVQA